MALPLQIHGRTVKKPKYPRRKALEPEPSWLSDYMIAAVVPSQSIWPWNRIIKPIYSLESLISDGRVSIDVNDKDSLKVKVLSPHYFYNLHAAKVTEATSKI